MALGRKNYLFAGAHEGAKRAVLIYSLFGTTERQALEPWEHLKDVPALLPDHSHQQDRRIAPARLDSPQQVLRVCIHPLDLKMGSPSGYANLGYSD